MKKIIVLGAAVALFVVVTAYAAPKSTGIVKLKNAKLVLELTFNKTEKVNINSKGMAFPEGTYTPDAFAILGQASDGKVWRLKGSVKSVPALESITVTKDQPLEVDIGPPLKVAPMVYKSQTDKAGNLIIPIGYTITGKSGEVYSLEMKVGAANAPLPVFQISDGNGKVLTEGKFEYG